MFKVTKRLKDANIAHRLLNYKGACENIHGHTYHFEIDISSDKLNELGMVIDFNEIKTKFIAIRDTSIKYSDNQYRLFEYTGEGTGYVEIPVLGTFGYNEYNQNNYNQTSSLTNKEFSPISIFSGTVAGPDGLWDIFENNIETEDLNDFYNFDSVEVFANTVKQLALNSGVKETIELLEDYLDPRTKIEVINFNDVGRTGQGVYIHETNTILINSESIRQGLNSGLELSEVLERLNSIFTEELF